MRNDFFTIFTSRPTSILSKTCLKQSKLFCFIKVFELRTYCAHIFPLIHKDLTFLSLTRSTNVVEMMVFFQYAYVYPNVSALNYFITVLEQRAGAISRFIFAINVIPVRLKFLHKYINEKRSTLKYNWPLLGMNLKQFVTYYLLHTVF